ncbi:MAG: hypothetical protein WD847_12990 [Pirellulales bacterium]
MNTPPDDPRGRLRRAVYLLLITASTGSMLGRTFAVNSVDHVRLEKHLKDQGRSDWQKQRPFLSANDRSRWATVRALVEHGTYSIDEIVSQPNWDTIDMVKHDGRGREAPGPNEGRLYSSKPPLIATLMAGPYWLIHRLTGATLATHPFAIGRGLIVLFNIVPMIVYLWVVAQLIERFGDSDWGRMYAMTAAAFGTFLTTFAVAINNHLPAAVCAAVALYAAAKIWYDGERSLWWFALAGTFSALTAACELPALAFFVAMTVGLLLVSPAAAMRAFVPPAFLVLAASMATNYLAHHSIAPPYVHRTEGDNWYDYQFVRDGKVRQSYWSNIEDRSPIDQGEKSPQTYALHVLVGHHGIFSLTPIWLFSLAGVVTMCWRSQPNLRALGLLVGGVSLVCLAFYLGPFHDRNYGGMSSGFRWMFWFAPLWLIGMLPAVDQFSERPWWRGLAIVFLCLSVLSASYPTWNPWTHPWLLDFLLHMEWARLGAG